MQIRLFKKSNLSAFSICVIALNINNHHCFDFIDSPRKQRLFASSWLFFWHVYLTSTLQQDTHQLITAITAIEQILWVLVQYCQNLYAKLLQRLGNHGRSSRCFSYQYLQLYQHAIEPKHSSNPYKQFYQPTQDLFHWFQTFLVSLSMRIRYYHQVV